MSSVRLRRIILAGLIGGSLGAAVAWGAALLATPVFRAAAMVEFVELPGNLPLSDAARDARIDGVVESADTLPVATSVLADRHIANEPQLTADARRRGGGTEAMARALIARLHAERIGGTTLIRLEANAADPGIATRIVGATAQALVRKSLADRIATVAPPDSALERDLAAARQQAEQRDSALAAFRSNHDLAGSPGMPLDPAEVTALRTSVAGALGEEAAARQRAIAASRHTVVTALGSGQNGTTGLAQLRVQRADLARRIAQLEQAFTPEYPPYQIARAELATLDRAIASELEGLAGSASADARAARSRADHPFRRAGRCRTAPRTHPRT